MKRTLQHVITILLIQVGHVEVTLPMDFRTRKRRPEEGDSKKETTKIGHNKRTLFSTGTHILED